MQFRPFAALALAVASGCSGEPPAGPADAAAHDAALDLAPLPPDLAFPLRDPTAHPDLPFIFFNGGHLLRKIQVVTVTWAGDPLADARAQFAAWMVNSEYYDQLAEYGMARGTALGPYALPGPPPVTLDDSAVGPLLRGAIANGTLPPPVTDSLYILYLPPGTESTMSFGHGCADYGGYHWFTTTGMQSPKTMAYAIIPACVAGDAQFDSDTVVASHEVAEAATDPEGSGWLDPSMPLSEIGDLCTPLDATCTNDPGDGGMPIDYQVSRLWSAKTAKAGVADPCLPAPPSPYAWFNAGAAPITVTLNGAPKVDVELDVEPFAYGPVGIISWQIVYGPGPGVLFSHTKGQGGAGSTQPITVTVTTDADIGPHVVMISSHAKTWNNVWYTTIDVE